MQELFSTRYIVRDEQGRLHRCHLDHLRPNTAMHDSNETSVINDEDDYGHQTILLPLNETTSGENIKDGQQEEELFQQTDNRQEGTNAETSLHQTNIDSTVRTLPRRS